jgi:hypothetical protein
MTQSLLAVVLSIGLSVVWLVPARGAPLAPTKPSQIVTLQPDVIIGTPPCSGVQLGVRQIVNPDLTTSLLTIPDKQVLVVTSGTWRTGSAATPADRHLSLRLFLKDGTANQAVVVLGAGEVSDVDQRASGSFRLDPGFVVRPGQVICAELATNGLPVAVTVIANGYLTKDR